MTTHLLDANVLIALTIREHEHHERASEWLAGAAEFAVSPVVEGALVRFFLRTGESGATAHAVLSLVRTHPRCEFWPDDLSYLTVELSDLRGHRQVTDAYLAASARHHGGLLATLDAGLVVQHPDVARLLPE